MSIVDLSLYGIFSLTQSHKHRYTHTHKQSHTMNTHTPVVVALSILVSVGIRVERALAGATKLMRYIYLLLFLCKEKDAFVRNF